MLIHTATQATFPQSLAVSKNKVRGFLSEHLDRSSGRKVRVSLQQQHEDHLKAKALSRTTHSDHHNSPPTLVNHKLTSRLFLSNRPLLTFTKSAFRSFQQRERERERE